MNKSNKKVIGASPNQYDGLEFKSYLERTCYKKFKEANLDFSYEVGKNLLWKGTKLNSNKVKVFMPKNGSILETTTALRDMTYTPDFLVSKGNYRIYVETKGKENDVYPIKKKLFLRTLQEREDEFIYLFIEPHNVKQIMQTIEIINNL